MNEFFFSSFVRGNYRNCCIRTHQSEAATDEDLQAALEASLRDMGPVHDGVASPTEKTLVEEAVGASEEPAVVLAEDAEAHASATTDEVEMQEEAEEQQQHQDKQQDGQQDTEAAQAAEASKKEMVCMPIVPNPETTGADEHRQ